MKSRGYKRKIGKKGQITVEYLLLAVVLMAFFAVITKNFKNNKHLKNFQDKPNALFENMVENGNRQFDKAASQERHPNQLDMHYTPDATP